MSRFSIESTSKVSSTYLERLVLLVQRQGLLAPSLKVSRDSRNNVSLYEKLLHSPADYLNVSNNSNRPVVRGATSPRSRNCCHERNPESSSLYKSEDDSVFTKEFPNPLSPKFVNTFQGSPSSQQSLSSQESRASRNQFDSGFLRSPIPSTSSPANYSDQVDPLSSFITSTPIPYQSTDSFRTDRPPVMSPFTPYGDRSELDSTFSDSQPRDIFDFSSSRVHSSPQRRNKRNVYGSQISSSSPQRGCCLGKSQRSEVSSRFASFRTSQSKNSDEVDPLSSFIASTPIPKQSTDSFRSDSPLVMSPITPYEDRSQFDYKPSGAPPVMNLEDFYKSQNAKSTMNKSSLGTGLSGSGEESYVSQSSLGDSDVLLWSEDKGSSYSFASMYDGGSNYSSDFSSGSLKPADPNVSGQREESFNEPEKDNIFLKSNKVEMLNGDTFRQFLSSKGISLVMFYNSSKMSNKAGLDMFKQQFILGAGITRRPNHAYAAVDCAIDKALCNEERIKSYPTYRLFNRGFNAGAICSLKDVRPLKLKEFIERW